MLCKLTLKIVHPLKEKKKSAPEMIIHPPLLNTPSLR